jgi:hypothetical protein
MLIKTLLEFIYLIEIYKYEKDKYRRLTYLNNELYLLAIANLHLIEWKEYIQQVELLLE